MPGWTQSKDPINANISTTNKKSKDMCGIKGDICV